VENQTDRTAQYLRDAILAGQLRPNQMLVAADVAVALGVSRTPVREALQRLLQEGYATKLPNGFCVVAEHPATEMQESLEVEGQLLKLAVRLVHERAAAETLRILDECDAAMTRAIDAESLDEWTRAAQSWVEAVVSGSGNSVLASMMDSLKVHYWRHRWSRSVRLAECRNLTERYKRVSDALRAGDPVTAEEALSELGQVVSRYASMWSVETRTPEGGR
jgi:DNA-binding GntR family transcriptional regulator